MMGRGIDEIRAESDAVYASLEEALAGREGMAGSRDETAWSASQVYGHLARWLEDSHAALLRHRHGQPHPVQEVDEDTLNDRWAAEDAALTEAEARARCEEARGRLIAALEAIPAGEWDSVVEVIADDDTISHPRAHLAYLRGGEGEAFGRSD